jgi:hypothetical protein
VAARLRAERLVPISTPEVGKAVATVLLLFFLGVLREMPQGSCGKLLRRFASISVSFFRHSIY